MAGKIQDAANPSTPVELRKILAKDKDEFVRASVASNPSTPVGLLKILAKDKHRYVRGDVANNPSTPVELLKILAKDKDEFVRAFVASNPSTPVELLKVLAEDKDWSVRQGIAINPSTPVELLKVLAEDEDEESAKIGQAENPKTPVEILKVLAEDEDEESAKIRQAENPKTPVKLLKKFSQDQSPYVRAAVLRNGKVTGEILATLIDDEDIVLRWSVVGNAKAFKMLQKKGKQKFPYQAKDIKSIAVLMRKQTQNYNSYFQRGKEYSKVIETQLKIKDKKAKSEIAMICDLYNFIYIENKNWKKDRDSEEVSPFTKKPIDEFLDAILWSGWHEYDLGLAARNGCLFYEGTFLIPVYGASYDPWVWSWQESMYYMGFLESYSEVHRLWEEGW